jgi:nucleotidyltransferase substrate binding protein (TIGR01987 family)
MNSKDIRWIQRFSNYCKALNQMSRFIEKSDLNELEEQGLIQAFEYTHELAWKTLKDFLEDQGIQNVYGSKDATRAAFKLNLLEDGETWMNMIVSRNQTSHTYNESTTQEILGHIRSAYFNAFIKLRDKFTELTESGSAGRRNFPARADRWGVCAIQAG